MKAGLRHGKTGAAYTLEARAYNDGIAFRFVVPGADGKLRTPDEATAFRLPAGSTAFARRRGDRWFLAMVNRPTARTIETPLSFLGAGQYEAMLIRDSPRGADAVEIENATHSRSQSIQIELRAGGGFIARFSR